MMARYIDAEGLNLYDNMFMSEDTINKSGVYVRYRAVENLIKNAPTEDVALVIHAMWNIDEEGDFHCSRCKAIVEPDVWYWHRFLYCYHCGAKMNFEEIITNDRYKG